MKIEWKKILASLSLHTARYKSIFSFSEKLNEKILEKICQAQNFCDGKLTFNDVENHFIIRTFFSHIASATQFATILKGKFGCNTWYVHYFLALSFSVCTQCVLYTQSDVCVCASVFVQCKKRSFDYIEMRVCVSTFECWWNIRCQGWGKWNDKTKYKRYQNT